MRGHLVELFTFLLSILEQLLISAKEKLIVLIMDACKPKSNEFGKNDDYFPSLNFRKLDNAVKG